MLQFQNFSKYSLFACFVGFFSTIFVLFLQPLDPARFLSEAFNFSQAANSFSASSLIAKFAFWIAIGLFVLGIAGIFLGAHKRSDRAADDALPESYGRPEESEENWMFI
ncbi:hypothetical protein Q8A64_01355 [Oxalobacteraceae bacterium R-40]|uniref:Transmembrane protein n=1 Tax=Keguizhuia sedimenti TaxID=3064264 RepID=A0ABU1BJ64_9BURK|nr:hypothetical protein [Oxalobacteraceae bacterium R-40]